jgi:hypothetical protein
MHSNNKNRTKGSCATDVWFSKIRYSLLLYYMLKIKLIWVVRVVGAKPPMVWDD